MRNYLKFLATAIVTGLLVCMLCLSSFAASTVFSDVDDSNDALSEAVNLLSNLGVTNGTSATTFGTYDNVTREQMAAFIYRLLKSGKTNEGVANTTSFTDLEDATYFGYISWADALGIIKGTSETTFNPKGGITLQDAYTMVVRALDQEKEDFVYPYSHIDAAESEALSLDRGLASTINYDTVLTRGDVAIILYNAFFAETGIERTTQVERALGNGQTWVLEKKTYNPTLAEEIYNVEVGEFVVRATPKYAFNDRSDDDTYEPLFDGFDGDMLHVVAKDSGEPLSEFYLPYDNSGLRDKVDDYIMRTIKVYYTYVEENGRNKLDKVYFAHGDYKITDTNSVTVHYARVLNAEDRYTGTTTAKALGYLTVNKEKVYFFDAPYSYIKPNYNVALKHADEDGFSMEDARYYLRNEKNVKLINIKCVDIENDTYSYYIDETQPAASAEDIIVTLRRIYSSGVYKTKFYDVDGDGIYEYLHYMPATYGFMNGDDHREFASKMTGNAPVHEANNGSEFDLTFTPTIYYNGAKISGAAFNEGDMVVAHLNPAANMIEVMSVVKPYKGYASAVRTGSCIIKVDGVSFTGAYSYRVVEGFSDGNDATVESYNSYANRFTVHGHTNAANFPSVINKQQLIIGEIVNIYAYKIFGQTNILYYDHLEDAALTFGMDELLIPVGDEDDPNLTSTKNQFDPKIGDTVYYVEAYAGNKTRFVPLSVKDMYPDLDGEYTDGDYNIGNTMSTVDPSVRAYVDKICKFTVDSDGLYTLVPLLHALDSDGEYSGINRDSSVFSDDKGNKQFGNDFGTSIYGKIVKVAGNRYKLLDTTDDQTLLGEPFSQNGTTINYFNLTGASRIIIKNKTYDGDEVKVEYLEYDASNFGGTTESELTNIQYILKTVPGAVNRADLVLLYAEAEDFEFENKTQKNGWRIVAASDLEETTDGKYNNFYTLLNPFTGEVETGVESSETAKTKPTALQAPANVGDVVEVRQSRVYEDKYLGKLDLEDIGGGLVWITEFDDKDNFFTAVPVEATATEMQDGGAIDCEECFGEFIEGYVYDGYEDNFTGEEFITAEDNSPLYYQITDDTVVTVLKYKDNDIKAFEKGEFVLADASVIADPKSEYKCYNENVEDKNGNFNKKYAKHLKAYVYVAKEPLERELPEATFIIIVATGEENAVFSDHDNNFLDKNCPEA